MATSFSIEHDFPQISQSKFEKYLNDPKLNDMLKSALGFSKRELISKEEMGQGEEVIWRFLVRRGGSLPKALESALKGDALSFYETSRFVKKDHCIYWKMEPEAKGIKISAQGKWLLKSSGSGVKRIIDGEVSVNIPLLGKVMENIIISELKKSYEIEPKVQESFYESLSDP